MIDKLSLTPDFKLGFLGGGQLARMSAIEAFKLGIQVAMFGSAKDKEPLEWMTPHVFKGSFSDTDAIKSFVDFCDIVTLENEFIDSSILKEISKTSETPLYPSAQTFGKIDTKLKEKRCFEAAGIPVTPYSLINEDNTLDVFGDEYGWPYILKSSKGGYDGYGNKTIHDSTEARKLYDDLGGNEGREIIAEAFVPFSMELAIQVARNAQGNIEVFPCCETIQENHICKVVVAPARMNSKLHARIKELAIAAIEAIDGIGIYAFEFFLTKNEEILLNESAPRPHNSGHYTIEGCVGSQFENHVRAVLNLPLSSTEMRKPAAVMINLLGTHNGTASTENHTKLLNSSDGHLHLYGKNSSKVGRKMGHFTLLGYDQTEVLNRALSLTSDFRI
ncbi:MAG: 5-(carboxyamino)imidazole ribonucleotide synthase [Balneolales bacterium]